MEQNKLQNLLLQVRAVSERYSRINELTGEKFNVFRILKLESSEVRMHSAFIAELLNPKGSHGQGDLFLKLFTQLFCFKGNEIDTGSCIVEIEKHTGFISEDGTEGGRIDIVITDGNKNSVIIENKIYAGDQRNQLVRYHRFHNNADIIYLTLDGKLPSEWSKGDLLEDTHYKCFSYKTDVLRWLELCRKEVAVLPIIREAITHYINLVKHLTRQTINQNMQEEVSTIIKSNLEEAWLISENLDNACQKIADDFFDDLKKTYEEKGFVCIHNINLSNNFTSINIWKKNWQNVSISIMVHSYGKNMIYGVLLNDSLENRLPDDIIKELRLMPDNTGTGSEKWPWLRTLEKPYGNWNLLEVWKAILDGTMKKVVMERIDRLFNATEILDEYFAKKG
ncbi:hypothetical protein CKK33_17730 [Mucilaginibacter sp. MD40]|uniref:PDDEXK-like family protein n=1 Tax=Mucilaginibacter sp. MD40 TaxID=2029590 RepID=UPI000BACA755|nr:PD-(D/E)XK nuclease family protein [Mucilaginibacter sp. MD40]PAW95241.1 hypothetical protein CKK33_17730 [Mucilaginibacter sp. MD40]